MVKRPNYWCCYYLASGNRSCKTYQNKRKIACWKYPQPNIGGKFSLTSCQYNKYRDFFQKFTSAKYNAALIVSEVRKLINIEISPDAINNALCDIKEAKENIIGNRSIVESLSLRNKYTLVTHAVGYHYDVFGKGVNSMENKLCFSFNQK